jgi:hypothetical protein
MFSGIAISKTLSSTKSIIMGHLGILSLSLHIPLRLQRVLIRPVGGGRIGETTNGLKAMQHSLHEPLRLRPRPHTDAVQILKRCFLAYRLGEVLLVAVPLQTLLCYCLDVALRLVGWAAWVEAGGLETHPCCVVEPIACRLVWVVAVELGVGILSLCDCTVDWIGRARLVGGGKIARKNHWLLLAVGSPGGLKLFADSIVGLSLVVCRWVGGTPLRLRVGRERTHKATDEPLPSSVLNLSRTKSVWV